MVCICIMYIYMIFIYISYICVCIIYIYIIYTVYIYIIYTVYIYISYIQYIYIYIIYTVYIYIYICIYHIQYKYTYIIYVYIYIYIIYIYISCIDMSYINILSYNIYLYLYLYLYIYIYIFICSINLAHTIIPSGTPCSPSCPIQRSSKAKNRLRSVVEGAGENFVTVGVEVQWDDLRLGRRISTNGAPGFGKFHVRTYVGLEIGRETNHWCGCLVSHIFWLVLIPTPLKKMSSSVGMMTSPIYGKK